MQALVLPDIAVPLAWLPVTTRICQTERITVHQHLSRHMQHHHMAALSPVPVPTFLYKLTLKLSKPVIMTIRTVSEVVSLRTTSSSSLPSSEPKARFHLSIRTGKVSLPTIHDQVSGSELNELDSKPFKRCVFTEYLPPPLSQHAAHAAHPLLPSPDCPSQTAARITCLEFCVIACRPGTIRTCSSRRL